MSNFKLENLSEGENNLYLKAIKYQDTPEMQHWVKVNKSRENGRMKLKQMKRGNVS